MSSPQFLQGNWQYAMRRDVPRIAMPQGSAYNIVNGVVQTEGTPIRTRSGWMFWSDPVGTGGRPDGGIYAVFSTTAGEVPVNLTVTASGDFYLVNEGTATIVPGQQRHIDMNPVFHGGTALSAATPVYTGLIIIPDRTATQVPAVYNGTTLTSMSGNPPLAKYAAVYKDYTVLANGVVDDVYYPNRAWFSPPGDPCCATAATAWDTTFSWLDFSLPVKGVVATRNVLLFFHDTQISRLRGSTPPPEDDMVLDDPLYETTLLDSRSIVTWKDQIIYASREGMIRTDGVTFENITLRGGMLPYWQEMLEDIVSVICCAGIVGDRLIVSIANGEKPNYVGNPLDAFVVDLNSLSWTRIDNVRSISMWNGLANGEHELFTGFANDERVARLGSMFTHVGEDGYAADGNDIYPTMTIETPFYPLAKTPGVKRLKRGFVGYSGVGDSVVNIGYILNPEDETYTTQDVDGNTLYLTNDGEYRRDKFDINDQGYGIALKFTGQYDFSLYDIGVETWPLEGSRIV